jgi:hypothetical protein
MQLPADQRVAARRPLQLNLALDRRMGCGAIGIEVGRSVIAFNDGDGATGSEQPAGVRQGQGRPPEVLQDETNEDVIE